MERKKTIQTRQIFALFLIFELTTSTNFLDGVDGVDSKRDVGDEADATEAPVGDCIGQHYEYMGHKNVNVHKFRSRWNFRGATVAECALACNQLINFECKTFMYKHFYPGSVNGTCMMSAESEHELEPIQLCYGKHCKADVYYRIGCIPKRCDESKCPDVDSSFCHEGEGLVTSRQDLDACCPLLAECMCRPETCSTPRSEMEKQPPSGPGVVSATLTGACCPEWVVNCNVSECQPDEELRKSCTEAGQVALIKRGSCCREAKCVCATANCPLPARCKEGEEEEIEATKCCKIYRCQPKVQTFDLLPMLGSLPENATDIYPSENPPENATNIYPPCGENGEHGRVDPVWCEVILRVGKSETEVNLLFGLVTSFLVLLTIATICVIFIMSFILTKVGKNKLA